MFQMITLQELESLNKKQPAKIVKCNRCKRFINVYKNHQIKGVPICPDCKEKMEILNVNACTNIGKMIK